MTPLAWGRVVSAEFRNKVRALAAAHGRDPSEFMACMAFESAASFRADVRNGAGSGAVGLIQFMPPTALRLGTTVAAMVVMTPEQQLDYVAKYFEPYRGHLHNLGDVYMAILWPAGIGKSDDAVLFDQADPRHPKLYVENKGLDWNKNGQITRGEAYQRVRDSLTRGLLSQFVWTGDELCVAGSPSPNPAGTAGQE